LDTIKNFNLSKFNETLDYAVDIELSPKIEKLEEILISKKEKYSSKILGLNKN
jgi:hypothetical protein